LAAPAALVERVGRARLVTLAGQAQPARRVRLARAVHLAHRAPLGRAVEPAARAEQVDLARLELQVRQAVRLVPRGHLVARVEPAVRVGPVALALPGQAEALVAQAEPAVLARQARQVHRAWQALPEGPVELAGLVVLEPREQPGRAAVPGAPVEPAGKVAREPMVRPAQPDPRARVAGQAEPVGPVARALPELLGHLALPVERAELVEPEAWDLQVQRAQRE
jgi:hypothetical protein